MENDGSLKQYHKINVILWGSILSFVVILTFLAYFLDSMNTLQSVENAGQINQILFLIAVIIAFGILFFKRSLFNPKKLIETPVEKSLEERTSLVLAKLRKNYIIVWAMGETIGILGFINYSMTTDLQYLLVFSVVSIYSILINLPRLAVAERCVELVKENH
jgi:MFS family permease